MCKNQEVNYGTMEERTQKDNDTTMMIELGISDNLEKYQSI